MNSRQRYGYFLVGHIHRSFLIALLTYLSPGRYNRGNWDRQFCMYALYDIESLLLKIEGFRFRRIFYLLRLG